MMDKNEDEKLAAHKMIVEEQKKLRENLKGIKHIIAVHSGKGGVGKTFLAINIAYGFARMKKKAGLLDADIDCPNVPKHLGISGEISIGKEGTISPVPVAGVDIMSTAFMSRDESSPLVVRGPVKHQMLLEFLSKTGWGELDYLIIDLPPGTSDVPLSLYQLIPGVSVILISTPQKEALLDMMRSAIMAKQSFAQIIGMVENMSGNIWGTGKVDEVAKGLGIPMLATIPLLQAIAELSEAKLPALVNDETLRKEILEPMLKKIEEQVRKK